MHQAVSPSVVVLISEMGMLRHQPFDAISKLQWYLQRLVALANLFEHPIADELVHCADALPHKAIPLASHVGRPNLFHLLQDHYGIKAEMVTGDAAAAVNNCLGICKEFPQHRS